jgi:2-keto-4-pentenoate hydratase/2-oxohepta-3-ene-1,7-dioic acid hydratase in catechol pathway
MAEANIGGGTSVVSYAEGGGWRAGFLLEGRLIDAAGVPILAGHDAATVRSLVALGPAALAEACEQAADLLGRDGASSRAVEDVTLGPAIPDPAKILCAGLNYKAHAAESNAELPSVPNVFAKFQNCLVGHGAPVVLPKASDKVDWEGELAAVIGTRCKGVAEADALGYVAGYAVFNDVSARDLQLQVSQWTVGKSPDTFGPIGPGIVPAAAVGDPQALQLTTRVNGQVMQSESTAMMVFSVAELVAFLSSVMTLEPGDVIATGTPSGVGQSMNPPVFLKAGDEVEVEIDRVGLLRNPIVAG